MDGWMNEWSNGWMNGVTDGIGVLCGMGNQEFFGHIDRHSFLHGVQLFFSVDSGESLMDVQGT